jgi:hypothetical protein
MNNRQLNACKSTHTGSFFALRHGERLFGLVVSSWSHIVPSKIRAFLRTGGSTFYCYITTGTCYLLQTSQ